MKVILPFVSLLFLTGALYAPPIFSRVQMNGPWFAAENTQANVYRAGGVQQGGRVANLGAAYYEPASMGTAAPDANLYIPFGSTSESGRLSLEWWLTPFVGSTSGYVKMTKGLPGLGPYPNNPFSAGNISATGQARVTWRTGFNTLIVCQYITPLSTTSYKWVTGTKTSLPGGSYFDN